MVYCIHACGHDGIGRHARFRFSCFQRWGSSPHARTTSEQAAYRLLRLFSKVRAHSFRCSSFPTAIRSAGFAVGLGAVLEAAASILFRCSVSPQELPLAVIILCSGYDSRYMILLVRGLMSKKNSLLRQVRSDEVWKLDQRPYKKYFARTKADTMSKPEFEE